MSALQPSVPRFIIAIAALLTVAHYGPVEVLRLPVGRPPDDETAGHHDRIEGGRSCAYSSEALLPLAWEVQHDESSELQ